MNLLMSFLGRFIAILPRSFAEAICNAIGWILAVFPSPRKRVVHANLAHCFPEKSHSEIHKIAIETCRRTIEMGMFVLASPYIKLDELKQRVKISEYLKGEMKKFAASPRPLVLMIPHFCMMESITIMPAISEVKMPKTGVFYRPFDNPKMEKWIKNTREKYGLNLLSRRDGLLVACDYLKRGDCISILIDQDAGGMGALSMFFDRTCSCSEIAGLLIERTKCMSAIFWARRTGFWRSEISGKYFENDSAENVVIKVNRWLEDTLKTDSELCADWLWLHKRWKTQTIPAFRFKIFHRKDKLDDYKKFYNLKELPRVTRFYVSMPEDSAKLNSAIAAVRALYKSRPDVAFEALCKPEFKETLEKFEWFDKVTVLGKDSKSDAETLKLIREHYPELLIIFENGAFANSINCAIKPLQTYAFIEDGQKTKANCVYKLKSAEKNLPYAKKLEVFLKAFGLEGEVDDTNLS